MTALATRATVASGRRIELLDVLANGERTVEVLAREGGLPEWAAAGLPVATPP